MARLSEKYLAGFTDSDGHIKCYVYRNGSPACLSINWSQKTDNDEVIRLIERDYGGKLTVRIIKQVSYTDLWLHGKDAVMVLSRMVKFMVVKRHIALIALDSVGKPYENKDLFNAYIKEQRKMKSLPLPNFPARKWLAGFFDGDGCLSASKLSINGVAQVVVVIGAWIYDTESIELIEKCFGGNTYDVKGKPLVKQWRLTMPPSKAKEFLGYFAKYSIVKKHQIDFILSCAEMGHFRDGENIKAGLKQLKASVHRLSDSTVLNGLLAKIRDIPRAWSQDRRHQCCIVCGTNEKPHFCKGKCKVCFQKEYNHAYKKKRKADAIVGLSMG